MENWTVKSVDGADVEAPSAQEQEQAVLDTAVEQGEITPESAGHNESGDIKVNLDQPPKQEDNAIQEREAEEVPVEEPSGDSQEVEQEVREQSNEEEASSSPLERIVQDEVSEVSAQDEPDVPLQEEVKETIAEEPKVELPEDVDKLVQFLNDHPGATINDYVGLNVDIDKVDDLSALREYYKQTKPHMSPEDVDFLIDESFFYDEGEDPRSIKKKELAFKEELFAARNMLKANKDKYYSDLKLGTQNLTPEQSEAIEHYNNYKQGQEDAEKLRNAFTEKTNKVFNQEFKGFDFGVGENKFRYNVNDVNKVKDYQSDVNNFFGEFMKDGEITDAAGYHKAIFAAKNIDKIADHFYQQGRADAVTESEKRSKNINMGLRPDASSVTTDGGNKVRVVSGTNSNGLKIKMRNFNNN